MRLRLLSLLLPCLLLTACAAPEEVETRPKQYQATFLDVFDTVTTVMGYAESQEDFTETAEMAHDLLLEYHQLYDIYNDYEGIHNLKTVNDQAGIAPVTVDARILDLLLLCRDLYADSGGKVNAAMGSVLLLWHEAREASVNDPEHAYLPEEDAIQAALEHTSFDNVVLDEAASTVYLTDPAQRLDVGAVAKGYAAGAVAAALPTGMVLSLGGNVCVCPAPGYHQRRSGHQRGLSTVLHGGRRRLPPYHRPGYRLARPALPVRDGHLRGLGAGRRPLHGGIHHG